MTDTGTNNLYKWSVSSAAGKVCVSQGSANTFSSPTNGVVATIDSDFGFTGASDSATNTFNLTNCSLVLSTGTVSSIISARHQGLSTFATCAITTEGGTAKGNYDFCTNISSSGLAFNGAGANYELMAPTVTSTIVNNYYFYAELS